MPPWWASRSERVHLSGRLEKMWMPASESEILAAIEAGDLIETATFDAKAALPAKGKSKDLAIDVAAMANDGGTLLYGVGEDENMELVRMRTADRLFRNLSVSPEPANG